MSIVTQSYNKYSNSCLNLHSSLSYMLHVNWKLKLQFGYPMALSIGFTWPHLYSFTSPTLYIGKYNEPSISWHKTTSIFPIDELAQDHFNINMWHNHEKDWLGIKVYKVDLTILKSMIGNIYKTNILVMHVP